MNCALCIDIDLYVSKANLLLTCCRLDGNLTFDGHRKTRKELNNEEEARNLADTIRLTLQDCQEQDIPSLLNIYDLLHRIGYGGQPDPRFIADCRAKVVNAWENGNKAIGESQVYPLLQPAERNAMRFKWLQTLMCHNRFPGVTADENYRRLTHLMRDRIDAAIEDPRLADTPTFGLEADELKWEWYKANRIDADELHKLSTPLLKTYRSFNSSLFPAVMDYDDQQDTDADILAELLTRHDLTRWDREAYRLLTRPRIDSAAS